MNTIVSTHDEETAAPNTLAAHWQLHIEAWEDSGQSHAAYCREHDLAKSRFNYWKHKLPPAPLNLPGSSFVPVRVMGDTNPGLTLHLPNGASIEGICEDTLGVAQQLASTWPPGYEAHTASMPGEKPRVLVSATSGVQKVTSRSGCLD